MKIHVLDSTECYIPGLQDQELVAQLLSHDAEYYRQGRYGKQKEMYKKSYVDKSGRFPTGLLPKVMKSWPNAELVFSYLHQPLDLTDIRIEGITPRSDQLQLVDSLFDRPHPYTRGVILSATGTGKTIISMMLSSRMSNYRGLYLFNRTDLVHQTYEAFQKHGFTNIGIVQGEHRKFADITFASVQTLARIDPATYAAEYDYVVADECHYVSTFDCQFAKIIRNMVCDVKIGLTATDPTEPEQIFALEGVIGPVVAEFSVNEAVEQGILARPKIKLIPVPYETVVYEASTYRQARELGIVHNPNRNGEIVRELQERIPQGEVILIMVEEIAHGDVLREACAKAGVRLTLVHGEREQETRNTIRRALDEGKLQAVCCTKVWREGINIPGLSTVILAGGGKSPLGLLQRIGRGLRKTNDKEFVTIVDFLDGSHGILSRHTVERLNVYVSKGWL